MGKGTIIFVHGTGIRQRDFNATYENARARAAVCKIEQKFVKCAWGDPIGIEFEGKSLPEGPSAAQLKKQEEDFAQWNWLFDDPLFELYTLTVRDKANADLVVARSDELPDWEKLWNEIRNYRPKTELRLLLDRGGLLVLWPSTWTAIVDNSAIPAEAFEASAHELAEVSRALARSLVAQLHVLATEQNLPGPSSALRSKLVDRLLDDWGQQVLGLGDFFYRLVRRAGTRFVRNGRSDFNEVAALPIGDILLYQARGEEIRDFIRDKITPDTEPPITLLAHSLGGVACVDLLALPDAPRVDYLVTVGSQAPFLYEIGALFSLKPPRQLPSSFPGWLNVFDRNDFLSFFAGRLFAGAKDVEVESGQPFPDSHSAYFGNDAVWKAIKKFTKKKSAI